MEFTLSGPSRKRQRVVLTDAQKQAIVLYKEEHPKASLENVAEAIRRDYHLSATPGTSTIGDVLANKEKWRILKDGGSAVRHDTGSHPEVEAALVMWLNDKVKNVSVTGTNASVKAPLKRHLT